MPHLLVLTLSAGLALTLPAGNDLANTDRSAERQSAPAAAPLSELLAVGFRHYEQDKYDAARDLFERALVEARRLGDRRAEAEAHRGLGLIFHEKAEYPAARAELEQALFLFKRLEDRDGVARVQVHLGKTARLMGEVPRARELLGQALARYQASGDRRGQARALLSLAFLPGLDPAEQQRFEKEGLAAATESGDRRLQADFAHLLGDHLFVRGDYAAAEEMLERAAGLYDQLHARRELARVLTSQGRVERAHGYPARALDFYRQALTIQEEAADQQGVIQSINAIAVSLSMLGRHDDAIQQYERALALARQTGSPRLVTFQLGNLGGGYLRAGSHRRAIELLEPAVQEEKDPALRALRFGQLGQAHLALGDYAHALESINKALEIDRGLEDPVSLKGDLYVRAIVERRLGRLSDAIADARDALRVVEGLRARLVPADFMKRGFGDWHADIFAFSIQLMHEAGQPDRALEAAEQARARAFLDLLASREVQPRSSDRAEVAALQQIERELKAKGVDPAEAASAPTVTMTRRGGGPEVEALWRRWRSADPELRSLVSVAPPSLAEISAEIRRLRSTLLSYWVGPEETIIWIVRGDGTVRSERVKVSAARVVRLVQDTSASALGDDQVSPPPPTSQPATAARTKAAAVPRTRSGDLVVLSDTSKEAWRTLYDLLIRPIRHLLPPAGSLLTIEPNGPLLRLSFAALLDEKGRYLLESYPMHYVPAAAALQFTEKKKAQIGGQPRRYLFVADPAGTAPRGDGKPLPSLPGARREVEALARLVRPDAEQILAGSDATRARVLQLAHGSTVLHFATHAIVSDDRPLDSFLALGAGPGAPPDGGRLTVQDVYALDLHADLVVLSACRSGLGKISGDGIVGLARAFFYAGAASIVATVWDVADDPAVQLVTEFYRALRRAPDKSRALREAQLRLLRALREGRVKISTLDGVVALPEHPVLWAGYVLLGEP